MVAPNIATDNYTDIVVVTLSIVMDTVLADSGSHDPIFGISDGTAL